MGRVAKIGALPAMPPNVRWLVALASVHGRNVGRGRYGLRQCCDSAAAEARSGCEEGTNDSRTIRERARQ